MNYEYSASYTLTQEGKDFRCQDKIKIGRFSNKTERIVFEFDGSMPSYLKPFVAMKNPETGELTYDPLLYDREGEFYYYVIGTNVSFYVGVWSMTVIGVQEDYDISGSATIDETLIFYVSNPFKKIIVLQQEISDEAVALSHPNLDETLLDIQVLHDNVSDLSVQVAEIEAHCEEIQSAVESLKEGCAEMIEEAGIQLTKILKECEGVLEDCKAHAANCESIYRNMAMVAGDLGQSLRDVYSEVSSLLRQEFDSFTRSLSEHHNTCMNSLDDVYNEIIARLDERDGGGE